MTIGEVENMKALGAVGVICGRAFGAEGRHIPSDFDQRLLSATIPLLRGIARRFCIAAGWRKKTVVKALLTTGSINALATDSDLARAVLELA